ncbi:MAG: hypothetical protein IPP46_01505 [Bacteroidetes bacterium]|nr:hypothetical protein [Bacteroidota bacterium]
MRNLILCSCVLLITGCTEVKKQPEINYFSISTFLNKEIATLKEKEAILVKTIQQKNKTETRSVYTPDWENELKPFFESAIDRPAWKNSYQCDTTLIDSEMIISYTSNNKKAPVKLLRVTYLKDKVNTIFILFEKSNAWFCLNQQLTYQSEQGFTIHSEQKMTLSAPAIYTISAKFEEKKHPSKPL